MLTFDSDHFSGHINKLGYLIYDFCYTTHKNTPNSILEIVIAPTINPNSLLFISPLTVETSLEHRGGGRCSMYTEDNLLIRLSTVYSLKYRLAPV